MMETRIRAGKALQCFEGLFWSFEGKHTGHLFTTPGKPYKSRGGGEVDL